MSFQRSHVIVIARATMSTPPLSPPAFRKGIRCATLIARYWILFGSPKIACATRCATRMSNPSNWLVDRLRAPSSRVSDETPTTRRPRSKIFFSSDPAGSCDGAGTLESALNEAVAAGGHAGLAGRGRCRGGRHAGDGRGDGRGPVGGRAAGDRERGDGER